TQSYGDRALDASILVMPSVGFISATDPRFKSTLEACIRELQAGPYPLLYRYRNEDGLTDPEGAFLLPSFWMVEAIGLTGDLRTARAALAALIEHMSPVGLYSEEVHPESGDLLGNFPQGFSHLGLINAVFRLEELKRMEEGWEGRKSEVGGRMSDVGSWKPEDGSRRSEVGWVAEIASQVVDDVVHIPEPVLRGRFAGTNLDGNGIGIQHPECILIRDIVPDINGRATRKPVDDVQYRRPLAGTLRAEFDDILPPDRIERIRRGLGPFRNQTPRGVLVAG